MFNAIVVQLALTPGRQNHLHFRVHASRFKPIQRGDIMHRIIKTLLAAAALITAGSAFAQEKINLSIATGGTGGVYYPLGGGLANVLSKYVPGITATAEVTGGSVDNLKLI